MWPAHAACNMLASFTGADELEDKDLLEEYLEVLIRMKKTDPLKFWNNTLMNGTANASLARMALDFLLIPGKYTFLNSNPSYLLSYPVDVLATSMDAKCTFFVAGLWCHATTTHYLIRLSTPVRS